MWTSLAQNRPSAWLCWSVSLPDVGVASKEPIKTLHRQAFGMLLVIRGLSFVDHLSYCSCKSSSLTSPAWNLSNRSWGCVRASGVIYKKKSVQSPCLYLCFVFVNSWEAEIRSVTWCSKLKCSIKTDTLALELLSSAWNTTKRIFHLFTARSVSSPEIACVTIVDQSIENYGLVWPVYWGLLVLCDQYIENLGLWQKYIEDFGPVWPMYWERQYEGRPLRALREFLQGRRPSYPSRAYHGTRSQWDSEFANSWGDDECLRGQIKDRPVEFLGRQWNRRRGTHKSKRIIQIGIHKKIKNCINSQFPEMSQLEQAW